jgi:hypothetical protein
MIILAEPGAQSGLASPKKSGLTFQTEIQAAFLHWRGHNQFK